MLHQDERLEQWDQLSMGQVPVSGVLVELAKCQNTKKMYTL